MFAALLLAATLGQVAPAPADLWRPCAANPAYEVYGHQDAGGVFVYTKSRLKVAPKKAEAKKAEAKKAEAKKAEAKNFGVILEPGKLIASSVRGTDNELARTLAEAEHRAAAAKAEAPCPGPAPCPDRTPPSRPLYPQPLPSTIERDALIVVGIVSLAAIVGFAVLALCLTTIFVVIRAAWRFLTAPVLDRV